MHTFKAPTKKKQLPYWHELHNRVDCQDTNSFSRCVPRLPYCHPNPSPPFDIPQNTLSFCCCNMQGGKKKQIEILAGAEQKVLHAEAQQQGENIFLY